MNEKMPHHHEGHHERQEHHEHAHESDRAKQLEKAAEQARKHESEVDINKLEERAEHEARPAEALRHKTEEDQYKPTQSFVNWELKNLAYSRLLNRARKKLSPGQKAMSKVIHQPAINAVSEATAKTIGRPSGLLGGGILAFCGTTIYYYVCQHYGYDYNFFIFIFLLVVGLLTGWFAELLLHLLRKRA